MVETAGTKLRRARTQRQLSLADAARATKIRIGQLSDLENDDYSNFANLAYARGFLVSYGKYLHLDVSPYMDAFADANTFGLDDYQYLSDVPVAEYRARTRPWRKRRQNSGGRWRRWRRVSSRWRSGCFLLPVRELQASGQPRHVGRAPDLARLGETAAANGSSTSGESAKPAMIPVSSTPGPSASTPPVTAPAVPDIVPNNDENRTAAAALALAGQNNSPTALLTPLTMPAVKPPGSDANSPLASPTPGKDGALLVHMADPNAEAFRADASKPQKVSNDSRH